MLLTRFSFARLGWVLLPFAVAFGGATHAVKAGIGVDEPVGVDEPTFNVGVDEPSAPTEPGAFESPAEPAAPGMSPDEIETGPEDDAPSTARGLGVVAEFRDRGVPLSLLERLDVASQREAAVSWVLTVVEGLRLTLQPAPVIESVAVALPAAEGNAIPLVQPLPGLDELTRSTVEGLKLADALPYEEATDVRLAVHALDRWLAVRRAAQSAPSADADSAALAGTVASLDKLLADRPGSEQWRAFLMLPELAEMLRLEAAGQLTEEACAPALAVLARIKTSHASPAAQEFLSRPPLTAFTDELYRWTLGTIESTAALDAVRLFEESGDRAAGRIVAASIALGSRSADLAAQEYAKTLETRYRCPNVRLSVHHDLMNRFMPQPAAESVAVRETIADHPVTGRSTTVTKIEVKLVPDPARVSLELTARGTLWSRTIADASVARFATFGHTEYQAVSPMRLDAAGISVDPTQVYVNGNTRLLGISTDLENVPIIGGLVENYARSRHDEQKDAVKVEMESRVGQKVREKLDATLQPKLREAQASWNAQVLAPLARLSLRPEISDFQTTPDRIVIRTRLATAQQLASYTPRPLAPAESLASVQLHESAINNSLEQLALAGRRMSVFDVRDHIAGKLQVKPAALPDDVPTDLFFSFAPEAPVQIRCLDGVVELTLRLAKLEVGNRSGENFTVRVRYRLAWKEAGLELIRDGGIQLVAEGQSNGTRLFLRTVCLKMFPKSKPLTIVARDKLIDPRLADLTITHLLVRDGWVSAAIGLTKKTHTAAPALPPAQAPAIGAKRGRASASRAFPGRTQF